MKSQKNKITGKKSISRASAVQKWMQMSSITTLPNPIPKRILLAINWNNSTLRLFICMLRPCIRQMKGCYKKGIWDFPELLVRVKNGQIQYPASTISQTNSVISIFNKKLSHLMEMTAVIKTPNGDLPLLVGYLKDPEAQSVFETRMKQGGSIKGKKY